MNYFNDKSFWFFYHGLGDFEPGFLHSIGVEEKLDKNGNHLPVEFTFDCGPRYRLELLVWLEAWGMEVWIVDKKTQTAKQLGWWDSSEWHPFFFRWEELMNLVNYWSKDGTNPAKEALICLLARFTGNSPKEKGGKAEMESRKSIVRNAYQSLGLDKEAIDQLMPESFIVLEDYEWKNDSGQGWVFTGEYACYSIRNEAHLNGKNEFPFNWYKAMLEDIGAKA